MTSAEPGARRRRGAAGRAAIVSAAVRCLVRDGLHKSSTLRIQAEAGVSRGRLLHYFPSKPDLLIGAVHHVAEERFETLRAAPTTLVGAARARWAVEVMWSTYDSEYFWAAMELWIGARTDPVLAAALRTEEHRLGRFARGLCDELFGPDLTGRPGYNGLRDVLIASMRGVALTYTFEERDRAHDHHCPMWQDLACHRLGLVEAPSDAPTAGSAPIAMLGHER